jgi:hypothetical protein
VEVVVVVVVVVPNGALGGPCVFSRFLILIKDLEGKMKQGGITSGPDEFPY